VKYIEHLGGDIAGFRSSSATYLPANCVGQDTGATVISTTPADWSDQVADRLVKLLRLPEGWDGHNGKPLRQVTAEFACRLIASIMQAKPPLPQIMPTSNGGMQIEWHRKGWDIEIEVEGPNKIFAYARNVRSGDESEFPVTTDFSLLTPLVKNICD